MQRTWSYLQKILYRENPKWYTGSLLELINTQIAGYKINTQKAAVFLYTNTEHLKEKIKTTILFTIASKIKKTNKTLRNKFNQGGENACTWKIIEHCWKKLKKTKINGRISQVYILEGLILFQMSILCKSIYRFNAISINIPRGLFIRIGKF